MVSMDDGDNSRTRQRSVTAASKGSHSAKAVERTTSWLEYMTRYRQTKEKGLRSKSPGRRTPASTKSGSHSSSSSKSWHVKIPRQMVCSVMLIFLLIPLTIFWWKESHLHLHEHHEERAVKHLAQKRGNHEAFVTWMEEAEKEAITEHLLDKNITQGDPTEANTTTISNQPEKSLIQKELEQGSVGDHSAGESLGGPSISNEIRTLTGHPRPGSTKDNASMNSEDKNDVSSGDVQRDQGSDGAENGVGGADKLGAYEADTKESGEEGASSEEKDTEEEDDRDEEKDTEDEDDRDEEKDKNVDEDEENNGVRSQEMENNGEVETEHRRLRRMIKKTWERDESRRKLYRFEKPSTPNRSTRARSDILVPQWFLKLVRG